MILDKLALSLMEDKSITDVSFQFPNLTATCSDGTSLVINLGNAYTTAPTTVPTTGGAATYDLRIAGAVTATVNEGTSVTLTLTTTNVPNGTRLSYAAYAISAGMSAIDFSIPGGDPVGTANFYTTGNTTTFSFDLVADLTTEGPEWIELAVCPYYTEGSAPGTVLSNRVRVNVEDTSVSPTGAPTTTTSAAPTTSSDPAGTVVKITSSTYWSVPPGWTRVRAIIVAGGGGGGTLGTAGFFDGGGGGGAGGVVDITLDVSAGAMLPVVIGAGGLAGDAATCRGRNGGDSSFAFNTASGGGGGGGALQLTAEYFDYSSQLSQYVPATYDFHGLPGGSGGGSTAPYAAQAGYTAPGIAGQGFSGGEAYDNGASGGGGGAGSRGRGNGGLSWGPNKNSSGIVDDTVSGGSGLGYTFGGTSFVVGGGGGLGGCTWGSNPSSARAKGGWGGGGTGAGANPGAVSTGGGGGGGNSWWGGNGLGGAGGSGVVYLVKV